MSSVAQEIMECLMAMPVEKRATFLASDDASDRLAHYGIKYKSGRYPYGSGDNPYQHDPGFVGRVNKMRDEGFTYTDEKGKVWTGDTAIAKSMGMTTTEFRTEYALAVDGEKLSKIAQAKELHDQGLGATEIGKQMGVNESTVRSWLSSEPKSTLQAAENTATLLKSSVDEKGMIEVGSGVEKELGVSKEKMRQALYLLEREGYNTYSGRVAQVNNPGKMTTITVLCPPGTEHKDIFELENIHSLNEYSSNDNGATFHKLEYPASMDSKRLKIRYSDEVGSDGQTGLQKDGLVEIRRGVQDLSLGDSRYAQVRILVDGTHYVKGLAVYSDNMPDGVDVVFNTNKSKDTPKMEVLKPITADPDNPFGSTIKAEGQSHYTGSDGKEHLSLINKRADQSDWSEWKDALPSQFLSKQPQSLAKKQLNEARDSKQEEFDSIKSLENPTVKKYLLNKYADECESAAVHLQAAALPGQKYHVVIPINTLRDDEVYAPNYENGTKLALVRYPHGGTFEIPILTVNNKSVDGDRIIGKDAIDAIGITKKTADQLSGADFDGDTVMTIPTHDSAGRVKIASKPPLKQLEGFDPTMKYGPDEVKTDSDGNKHYYRDGSEYKTMQNKQKEMGTISNLITDMTLAGADDEKLARAVKHSMVVIDAEKHHLDYKSSYIENGIPALVQEFQPKENGKAGGAGTIVSRASGEETVAKRQGSGHVNLKSRDDYDPSRPEGVMIYKTADDLYYPARKYNKDTGMMTVTTTSGKKVTYDVSDKEAEAKYRPVQQVADDGTVSFKSADGTLDYKVKERTQASTKMAEVDDAYDLVSVKKHPMELLYADYANSMKTLAREARVEASNTGKIAYSREARDQYKDEVASLNSKLLRAESNAPKERYAQIKTNAEVKAKSETYKLPSGKTDNKALGKFAQQSLNKNRAEVGSVSRKDRNINITENEWKAIQSGAVSETVLKRILNNSDIDQIRELATPKIDTSLSPAQKARIKAYKNSNLTLAEIANKFGVSTSTVSKILNS